MLEPDNRLAFFACKFCRSRYNSGYFLQFNLHGRGGGIQSHSLTIQASNASQMRHGEAQALRQTTGRSEEHTSELQSLMRISYAVFCLKKKTKHKPDQTKTQHSL